MFICVLLTPLTMWGVGVVFLNHPPREINGFIGYRTKRSMRNQETWDFANRRMALLWRRWGLGLLAASIGGMMPLLGRESGDFVYWWGLGLMLVQVVVLVASIVPVERALKRTFHEDGTRKEGT